jgi:hypothetical protein
MVMGVLSKEKPDRARGDARHPIRGNGFSGTRTQMGTPEIHERHLRMEVHPPTELGTVRLSNAAGKRLSDRAGIFGVTNSV